MSCKRIFPVILFLLTISFVSYAAEYAVIPDQKEAITDAKVLQEIEASCPHYDWLSNRFDKIQRYKEAYAKVHDGQAVSLSPEDEAELAKAAQPQAVQTASQPVVVQNQAGNVGQGQSGASGRYVVESVNGWIGYSDGTYSGPDGKHYSHEEFMEMQIRKSRGERVGDVMRGFIPFGGFGF